MTATVHASADNLAPLPHLIFTSFTLNCCVYTFSLHTKGIHGLCYAILVRVTISPEVPRLVLFLNPLSGHTLKGYKRPPFWQEVHLPALDVGSSSSSSFPLLLLMRSGGAQVGCVSCCGGGGGEGIAHCLLLPRTGVPLDSREGGAAAGHRSRLQPFP